MRVVLFTGKGGVGKTTLAAATAAKIAKEGRKTLVLSTDAAHSLGDAYATPVPDEVLEVAAGLYVGHINTQRRMEQAWGEIQRYLMAALDSAGVDDIRAEELSVLPGASELLALIEVRDQVRSGRWDAVLVDCGPTAETLRLLSLPEVLDWYLTRSLPVERRVVRALRPFLGPAIGLPAPGNEVWEAADRLRESLLDVQTVLKSPETSVRLVMTPERVVAAEARRSLTQISLYGYSVDAVVVNRVFSASSDPWRNEWAQSHDKVLKQANDSFAPLPVFTSPYRSTEPVGPDELADLGSEIYRDRDPLEMSEAVPFMRVEREGDGFVLSLALPLIEETELDLARIDDELVITVNDSRRVLSLPSALRRCAITRAKAQANELRVHFKPKSVPTATGGGAHP